MLRNFNFLLSFLLLIPIVLHSQVVDSSAPPTNINSKNASEAFVIFNGDTLFSITASFGSYTPADRAKTINERLEAIADEIYYVEDSFNIVELTNYSVVRYKEKMILSVNDEEAAFSNLTRQEAAMLYKDEIKTAFIFVSKGNLMKPG